MNKAAAGRNSWLSFTALVGACFLLGCLALSSNAQTSDLFQEGYQQYINGDYQEALKYYEEAVAASPDSADAYLWRAKCRDKLGNRTAAVWDLKKALRLDPRLWGAKYLLAKLNKELPANYPSQGNISLDFSDLDVRQVIFILAKETGLNLVPGALLQGKITLSLTDVSTTEALQAVLEAAQARLVPQGSLLKVLPLAEQYEVVETPEGAFAKTYRLDYVPPASVVESLKGLLPAAEMMQVSTIKDTNYILLQGPKAVIRKADAIIRNIDIPPKQVMVEAKVVEIRVSDISNLGVDFKATRPTDANDKVQTLGQAGRATDTGAQGIYAQILSTNVEAYLSALSTQTQTNLIASPRITTLSDRTANILIGSKFGYKTAIITDTSTTQQIQFLEVGTSLSITPAVTRDGFIKMKVAPKVSDGQVVNDLPQENTTETANEVMVRDGQTIVIGGLIKNKEVQTDAGVPILMNVPFLGGLFRKTTVNMEKSELLVFITPHILTPERLTEMNQTAADYEKRTDEQKARLIH